MGNSCGTYSNLVKQAQSKQKIIDKMMEAGLTPRVDPDPTFRFKFPQQPEAAAARDGLPGRLLLLLGQEGGLPVQEPRVWSRLRLAYRPGRAQRRGQVDAAQAHAAGDPAMR